jgi:hypothetical protein
VNNVRRGLQSEQGQGILEYILLIVVVIMLATLLANRFFKPFRDWAQHHIGSYVECLLDQGELPGLGGENGVQDCEFESPFQEGGASKDGSDGSAGKGTGSEENDGEKESENDLGKSDQRTGRLSAVAGGRQRSVRVGGFDGASESKSIVVEQEGEARDRSAGTYRGRYGSVAVNDRSRPMQVTGLGGMIMAERERIKKREEKVNKVAEISEDGDSRSGRKLIVNPELRTRVEADVASEGFSFGKIFRLLIIIFVAIALILFVGGQLAQISKSMEK